MMRPSAIPTLAGLLCACTTAPEATPPGTEPGTTFGEPISTQQVLQGIQIGEGGDLLPCDPVLTSVSDPAVDELFAEVEGSWTALPYAYGDLAGSADVTVALSTTWELTWTDYATASTSFACAAERPVSVAGLWIRIDGDDVALEQAVFASALDAPSTTFVGEATGGELGLDGSTYDLQGVVIDVELEVEVYEDLIYGQSLGSFAR